MKKSAAKASTPVSLGTKRTCPKCGVKFYDFNKKELNCPKCATELDEQALAHVAKLPTRAEKKEKPEPAAMVQSDEGPDSGPEFESVDDLDDDDATDDIEVVEDKDEDY